MSMKYICNSDTEPDNFIERLNPDYEELCSSQVTEHFHIRPVECCGWFNVHSFGKQLNQDKVKQLTWVTNDLRISVKEGWSNTIDEPAQFTLFCVLVHYQVLEYKELLLSLGWKQLPTFKNPNTNNHCTPFMYIPPERVV